MVGASMLWVGWFGFNAGSALAAGADAGMAMLVTHISAATAALVWMAIEWVRFGKPSMVGMVTGHGRRAGDDDAGFRLRRPGGRHSSSALPAARICYLAVDIVKQRMKIDDSLDVLAVHGVGGATGTLLTAFFADAALGGVGLAEGEM